MSDDAAQMPEGGGDEGQLGEQERRVLELAEKVNALEGELGELRLLKMKLDAARELGRPDLLRVVDGLPNVGDKEALKAMMSNLASFADEAVKERERQLMAGVTPSLGGGRGGGASGPTSEGEWMRLIESKPLGSGERQRAWDDYWTFLETRNRG